jgi:hypothetical protein
MQIIQSHSVFRIDDVLIQIQICRSVPLDYGSGSCSFLQWLPTKNKVYFPLFFGYHLLLITGTFTLGIYITSYIRNITSYEEVTKIEIKVFLYFFAC